MYESEDPNPYILDSKTVKQYTPPNILYFYNILGIGINSC
jgi:hypothetical protein